MIHGFSDVYDFEVVATQETCENSQNTNKKNIVIKTGASFDNIFILFGWKFLRSREFITTDTEDSAIASQASSGFNMNHKPAKTHAATGIHKTL